MNKKTKSGLNMTFIYLINLYHFFVFLFPYPLRNGLFKLGLGKLGRHSTIDNRVYFKFPWLVEIGAGVSINRGVEFYPDYFSKSKIYIHDNVRIAPNAKFHASGHDLNDPTYDRHIGAAITVRQGAWIGAAAIILPGVTIGEKVVIAAGAVVSSDALEPGVYAGVPARKIKDI